MKEVVLLDPCQTRIYYDGTGKAVMKATFDLLDTPENVGRDLCEKHGVATCQPIIDDLSSLASLQVVSSSVVPDGEWLDHLKKGVSAYNRKPAHILWCIQTCSKW